MEFGTTYYVIVGSVLVVLIGVFIWMRKKQNG
jgi:LPXTG-motif cell wall-anchored protein